MYPSGQNLIIVRRLRRMDSLNLGLAASGKLGRGRQLILSTGPLRIPKYRKSCLPTSCAPKLQHALSYDHIRKCETGSSHRLQLIRNAPEHRLRPLSSPREPVHLPRCAHRHLPIACCAALHRRAPQATGPLLWTTGTSRPTMINLIWESLGAGLGLPQKYFRSIGRLARYRSIPVAGLNLIKQVFVSLTS